MMPQNVLFGSIAPAAFCLVLGIQANGLHAAPAPAAQVKQLLQRIYAAQDIAIAHKNLAAFYKVCAPSFVAVDAQGRATTLAQDKANFATICANSRSIATNGVVQSVALMPDGSALAIVKVRIKAVSINPRAEINTTETVRDIWLKTAAGWKEIASRTLTTHSVAKPVRLDSFPTRPLKH